MVRETSNGKVFLPCYLERNWVKLVREALPEAPSPWDATGTGQHLSTTTPGCVMLPHLRPDVSVQTFPGFFPSSRKSQLKCCMAFASSFHAVRDDSTVRSQGSTGLVSGVQFE